ncbi:MAG: hypothetical protein IPL09_09190 [Bacteroidetes bacterium]|jgi:hypothetical protein|nr:hypothetical protein [Bacteroidota bacterium]HMT35263.1 hypothetical protein [Chitinophagaceae bacterium]MBK6820594.1 hypothetical protein [Bacteroidota bacterium]MBK7589255.1 hypothetical protein [Bacteroidota bacterium]MBK8329629.1 hypothetical protein [Bacteroidota bacterium]
MNTSNDSKKGISSSWIYLGIIIILIAGGIYLMLTKNMSDEENIELANQVEQVNTDKNTLEQEYNAALAKLDDLKTKGQQMETILAQKNAEVENLKNQIKNILGKKNASDMELMQANKLIATLNDKLNNYASQNQQIQASNDKLTAENQQYAAQKSQFDGQVENLNTEKKELEEKIEKGSVLVASGFKIQAYNKKKKFLVMGKQVNKETGKAKKADVLNITFDIDANRVSESGNKTIYVCLTQPDGNLAFINGDKNQQLKLMDGSEKKYSGVKNIAYQKGERQQALSIDWESQTDFLKGNYIIELYEMGYKIGQATLNLK